MTSTKDKIIEEFRKFLKRTQLKANYCPPPLRGWVPANDALELFITEALSKIERETIERVIGSLRTKAKRAGNFGADTNVINAQALDKLTQEFIKK